MFLVTAYFSNLELFFFFSLTYENIISLSHRILVVFDIIV